MTDDKQVKERIAQGMDEVGKQEKGKTGGDAMAGKPGHGSDAANIGRDMAESSAGRDSGRSGQKTGQQR
ncbi:MAG: hypothetical protein AB7I59_18875 [Geminicoccaceae bacterium]